MSIHIRLLSSSVAKPVEFGNMLTIFDTIVDRKKLHESTPEILHHALQFSGPWRGRKAATPAIRLGDGGYGREWIYPKIVEQLLATSRTRYPWRTRQAPLLCKSCPKIVQQMLWEPLFGQFEPILTQICRASSWPPMVTIRRSSAKIGRFRRTRDKFCPTLTWSSVASPHVAHLPSWSCRWRALVASRWAQVPGCRGGFSARPSRQSHRWVARSCLLGMWGWRCPHAKSIRVAFAGLFI